MNMIRAKKHDFGVNTVFLHNYHKDSSEQLNLDMAILSKVYSFVHLFLLSNWNRR